MPFVLLLVTLVGLAYLVVGWLALVGRNPAAWYAASRAAAPLLIWSGVAALAAGLAFVPFALAGKLDDGLVLGVVLAVAAVLVFGAAAGWLYSSRATETTAS